MGVNVLFSDKSFSFSRDDGSSSVDPSDFSFIVFPLQDPCIEESCVSYFSLSHPTERYMNRRVYPYPSRKLCQVNGMNE